MGEKIIGRTEGEGKREVQKEGRTGLCSEGRV